MASLNVSASVEPFAATIPAPITIIPPAAPSKRPRSRESRILSGRPAFTRRDSDGGPTTSPAVRIPAFLTQTKAEIGKLFQELEWRQRFRLQHALTNPESSPFRLEKSPVVLSRNRYGNVQPWDHSRVRLKVPIDGSDYVNASPISLTTRPSSANISRQSSPSINQQHNLTNPNLLQSKYIATQGPKDGQFSHFWNIVMQETVGDVGVVVMLTQCWEGSREKCGQYFPATMDVPKLDLEANESGNQPPKSAVLSASDLQKQASKDESGSVRLLDFYCDTKSRSEVRKLELRIGEDTKTVWHYLFNGWPDYAKPEGEDRAALLELMKQSTTKAGGPLNPRIVHCSAGVGRTGTFIALDHLLRELDHGLLGVTQSSPQRPSSSAQLEQRPPEASEPGSSLSSSLTAKDSTPEATEDLIFETVNTLREQRMMMVMNDVQFSFLYEVMREAYVDRKSNWPNSLTGRSGEEPTADGVDAGGEFGGEFVGHDDDEWGEPSPKLARTDHMPFVGSPDATRHEIEELARMAVNQDAVTANDLATPEVVNEASPAADDAVVVRPGDGAREDAMKTIDSVRTDL